MVRLFTSAGSNTKLLSLEKIVVHYAGVRALDFKESSASLHLNEGEVIVLLGPNGAGKSTLLKTIFGLTPVSSGDVMWRGKKVECSPNTMMDLGVSFVSQDKRVFPSLSVLENIELGGLNLKDQAVLKERLTEVLHIFPDLKPRLNRRAGMLSGGQQQMVAIARGLVARPKVLLLDEPSVGLSPKIVKNVLGIVRKISQDLNMAVVIVEHNVKSALEVADRAYILDKGSIVFEGPPQKVQSTKIFEKVLMNEHGPNK